MEHQRKNRARIALLSYCTTIGLCVDLNPPADEGNLIRLLLLSLKGYPVEQALLFVGLCGLYALAFRKLDSVSRSRRNTVCALVPAGLFAAFMVTGYSFEKDNSLNLVLSSGLQMVKSFIAFGGYFILFSIAIATLYACLPSLSLFSGGEREIKGTGLWCKFKRLLRSHPFCVAFVTLLIVYIPYVILSYPAIFMGDCKDMILQGYNLPGWTSSSIVLLDESVYLNGHHPIAYTMLIHLCLVIGDTLFHSYNVGIFLVSLLQLLAVVTVASYSISVLSRRGASPGPLLPLILYIGLAPRMQNYMFVISKDVLAGCALTLFILSLYRLHSEPHPSGKTVVMSILSGVAMSLLRNDGKYIILGSVAVALVMDRAHRKQLAAAGLAILLTVVAFFNGLMPALHITSGSIREMLSIPFQQTARYFQTYEEEVTEEEWTAVNGVLDAASLKERYFPAMSDNVKNTYRKTATREDLLNYFRAWFQMGLKHPGVYLQATMNNYYNYFYPGLTYAGYYPYAFSENLMESVNTDENLKSIGVRFHYPEQLDRWREQYQSLRESLFAVPVLSLLEFSATFTWVLLLLVFFLIREREWQGLTLTVPLLFSLLVCLAGPCNGDYFRYLYGISLSLPFVILQTLELRERHQSRENRNERGQKT